jgi:hypothetical protein
MTNYFRPFSNCYESLAWRDRNCARCTKDFDDWNWSDDPVCPMEEAISMTMSAVSHGDIPLHLAERIGIVEEPHRHLGACKEFEAQENEPAQ